MKTIKLEFHPTGIYQYPPESGLVNNNNFSCYAPDDKTGEYVRAEDVADLLEAAKQAVRAMQNSSCDSAAQDNLRDAIKKFETD